MRMLIIIIIFIMRSSTQSHFLNHIIFILSWLDYCNCLLAGPRKFRATDSAPVVFWSSKPQCRFNSLLHVFHWFPVYQRIHYKFSSSCFSSVTGPGPYCPADTLIISVPSWQLHPSSAAHLSNPFPGNKAIWPTLLFKILQSGTKFCAILVCSTL